MWALLLFCLVQVAFGGNALDQELESMTKELDNSQPQAVQAKEQVLSAKNAPQMSDKDVKRYVDVEPGEEIALVQYNVAPQIISTRPGDKIAILPVSPQTTPCPPKEKTNPHPHTYCQSCGKENPKERGEVTSYIDVTNSKECASLCARYLGKDQVCDGWEYHGEWRNKQCFLLHNPNASKCKGDIGLLGDMAFESGTCDRMVDEEGDGEDEGEDLEPAESEEDEKIESDGLPSWFPRVEAKVGNALGTDVSGTALLAVVGVCILLMGVYRYSKRPTTGYVELLDKQEEV